jgi:ABC-type Fe3+-siderophore transport system permease subunit
MDIVAVPAGAAPAAALVFWLLVAPMPWARRLRLLAAAALPFGLIQAANLDFFLAQRDSRPDQFEPFAPIEALVLLVQFNLANLFGGLPLYVDGPARAALSAAVAALAAGAALAVVITSALGMSLPFVRTLVAAAGAAALFLLVLMFSSSGRTGLTPMKVTLCGVAMSAFASSITAAVLILDEQTLLAMRTWLAGDLAGINVQTLRSALWAAAAGFVLAIGLSPSLNMLALGDRMAQGLGVSLLKTRLLALLAIAVLARPVWDALVELFAEPWPDRGAAQP